MEFLGTKGKWTRYVSNTPNKVKPTAHSVYVGTKRIALCYDFFESDESKNVSNIEAEANSKLIAAAPDLLEALIELVNKNPLHKGYHETKLKGIKAIEKALNKSYGKRKRKN